MLQSLISNQSLEKILFFLLLNGKCYASQLSRRFKTPLTPIQHSLYKLETGGVIASRTEGKIRTFEFNPDYPLLPELEGILKKAYFHLPTEEKKKYYSPSFVAKTPRIRSGSGPQTVTGQKTVQMVWDKLSQVQTLCFSAKSKSQGSVTGWNGIGKGEVEVKRQGEDVLLFHEKGKWVSEDRKEFDFRNVFRWTLKREDGVIVLEHLRMGVQNPVHLFSLVPIDAVTLESFDAHSCKEDSYFGQLRCDRHYVQFNWRVIGSKKNEEIDYLYT